MLQTEFLTQMKQKYPMNMSANISKSGTVSLQLKVNTRVSKKSVKSKIEKSAFKGTLKYFVRVLDVKELKIVNLNI